ncbi:MAG: hypothetical protein R8F63_04845 [Acidimicrobiales bacterium]|nr:hypothetical protein [Acidimicrobiales bacterium]
MRPTRQGSQGRTKAWIAAGLVSLLVTMFLAPSASAQDDPIEPVDTDGDGQRDDWDGDGLPDNDDDLPCQWDDKDNAENTGTPDGIPDAAGRPPEANEPPCVGEGGGLPDQLSLQQISVILSEVFAQMPDVTEPGEEPDGWPNIRRLIENGADAGPDWTHLDDIQGEPGVDDLLQELDDRINQEGLEDEDINNFEFEDPLNPGSFIAIAEDESLQRVLTQIQLAREDQGLVGGSASELTGPCMGMAWSFDSDGQPLDIAWDWDLDGPPVGFRDGEVPEGELAVEEAFTSDNPFEVDVNGAVIYTGVAGGTLPGQGPLDHDWFIRLEFLGTGSNIDAGGDPNRSGENRNLGAVNLNEDLPGPAKLNMLVSINGQMSAPSSGTGADDGTSGAVPNGLPFFCIGSGFVDFQGGFPLAAPGAAIVFLATVGMLFNARPAKTWGGV